jgi:hypothetical protein
MIITGIDWIQGDGFLGFSSYLFKSFLIVSMEFALTMLIPYIFRKLSTKIKSRELL